MLKINKNTEFELKKIIGKKDELSQEYIKESFIYEGREYKFSYVIRTIYCRLNEGGKIRIIHFKKAPHVAYKVSYRADSDDTRYSCITFDTFIIFDRITHEILYDGRKRL